MPTLIKNLHVPYNAPSHQPTNPEHRTYIEVYVGKSDTTPERFAVLLREYHRDGRDGRPQRLINCAEQAMQAALEEVVNPNLKDLPGLNLAQLEWYLQSVNEEGKPTTRQASCTVTGRSTISQVQFGNQVTDLSDLFSEADLHIDG